MHCMHVECSGTKGCGARGAAGWGAGVGVCLPRGGAAGRSALLAGQCCGRSQWARPYPHSAPSHSPSRLRADITCHPLLTNCPHYINCNLKVTWLTRLLTLVQINAYREADVMALSLQSTQNSRGSCFNIVRCLLGCWIWRKCMCKSFKS